LVKSSPVAPCVTTEIEPSVIALGMVRVTVDAALVPTLTDPKFVCAVAVAEATVRHARARRTGN
jgi:hypothetical protein